MRPVIFIGFNDATDMTFLNHCISLLLEVSRKCKDFSQELTVKDLCKELVPLVKRVASIRKDIDVIKDAASKIVKTCDGVYAGVKIVFDEIVRLTGSVGSAGNLPKPGKFACPNCPRTFQNNKGLTLHAPNCVP